MSQESIWMEYNGFGGDLVRAPRPSDGVGDALRDLYANNSLLPLEWRALLTLIDWDHHED